jgi:hypothetical protein
MPLLADELDPLELLVVPAALPEMEVFPVVAGTVAWVESSAATVAVSAPVDTRAAAAMATN